MKHRHIPQLDLRIAKTCADRLVIGVIKSLKPSYSTEEEMRMTSHDLVTRHGKPRENAINNHMQFDVLKVKEPKA